MKNIQISPNFTRNPQSPPIPSRQYHCPVTQGSQIRFMVSSNRKVTSVQKKSYLAMSQKPSHHPYDNKGNGKQNFSPFIIDQRNLTKPTHNKMINNISNHCTPEINSFCEKEAVQQLNNQLEITPFEHNDLLMDSYCPKMAQSIIMSDSTMPSFPQLPSDIKFSDFQKIKFLGKGKFGQVFLMMHQQTGFICALKMIDKKVIKEEKLETQIAKEIRIHNCMKHLNIINFYGFFDDTDYLYILLEYACEGSLYSKLNGRNRLEEEEIRPIVKQVTEGIQYIHQMGYIHRDLKPENIVIQFGIPKICDFGWSTLCYDSQLCKSYCGTPLYLSPEMVKKQKYTNLIDVWSIGLLTYEILVGRGPFGIWSEHDLNRILETEIAFPHYIDKSEQCESFILKCLEKNPNLRICMQNLIRHPFIFGMEKKELDFEFYDEYARLFNIY